MDNFFDQFNKQKSGADTDSSYSQTPPPRTKSKEKKHRRFGRPGKQNKTNRQGYIPRNSPTITATIIGLNVIVIDFYLYFMDIAWYTFAAGVSFPFAMCACLIAALRAFQKGKLLGRALCVGGTAFFLFASLALSPAMVDQVTMNVYKLLVLGQGVLAAIYLNTITGATKDVNDGVWDENY